MALNTPPKPQNPALRFKPFKTFYFYLLALPFSFMIFNPYCFLSIEYSLIPWPFQNQATHRNLDEWPDFWGG